MYISGFSFLSATCIFELLRSELPDDFQETFGLSWNLLKASVGIKPGKVPGSTDRNDVKKIDAF